MSSLRTCIVPLLLCAVAATARGEAIHDAVRSGDLDAVKRLLSSNSNLLHAENVDGLMPIHLAADRDRRAILRYLLANGAGVNDKVVGGMLHIGATPLFIACENDHTELAMELLEKGADAAAPLKSGWAPIHHALHFGDRVLTEKLIEHGAGVNAGGPNETTPLFSAMDPLVRVSEVQRLVLVRLLISKGADIHAKSRGDTLLHIAAQKGWLTIAALLLNSGIDVNTTDSRHLTAFGIASKSGDTKMMDLLKSHGGTE